MLLSLASLGWACRPTAGTASSGAVPTDAPLAGALRLRISNRCASPVWVGTLSAKGSLTGLSGDAVLTQGSRFDLTVTPDWSGRVWGRTGCTFDTAGKGRCVTGDCGGQAACTGSGATPATLAEFTFGGAGDQVFYDVSLVDGFNVPMRIEPGAEHPACGSPECAVDLNATCEPVLQKRDDAGATVACKSACDALGTEEACCSGAHNTPETCPPTDHARTFKAQCPTAYSYAYDDPSSTFTCAGTAYHIIFCPE
ncbi:MAG TPA: thaumatin family protein [Myxococcota bacterium]|nr:thaumatin family protein [Myxococcota bacterium]